MDHSNGSSRTAAAALALVGLGAAALAAQGGCDADPAPVVVRPDVTDVRPAARRPPAVAATPPPTVTSADHVSPTPRRVHTVQRGETLTAIARAEYGSGALWHRLAAANPASADGQIRAGQQIVVP